MSNTDNKILTKRDQQDLFEELEKRFGYDIALDLVESITLAASSQNTPDYMPVKASSELLETFRGETQDILGKLKKIKAASDQDGENVYYIEKRKLEIEFRRTYRLYRISMGLFYPMYYRALADYTRKIATYGRPSKSTPKSLAA